MIQFIYQLTNMNTTHNEVTGTANLEPAVRKKLKEPSTFYSLAKQLGTEGIRMILLVL